MQTGKQKAKAGVTKTSAMAKVSTARGGTASITLHAHNYPILKLAPVSLLMYPQDQHLVRSKPRSHQGGGRQQNLPSSVNI